MKKKIERLLKPGMPKKRLNGSTKVLIQPYHIDFDWYLNNGYIEISEARRIIEGPYYEQNRQK